MHVRESRGFVSEGVDMQNLAAILSRRLDGWSEVRVASKRVNAPQHDELGVNQVLWIGPKFIWPVVRFPCRTTGGSTNGLIQFESTDTSKERERSLALHDTHRATIGVRQNGLRSMLGEDIAKPLRNLVQRDLPGDTFESPFTLWTDPSHGMQ